MYFLFTLGGSQHHNALENVRSVENGFMLGILSVSDCVQTIATFLALLSASRVRCAIVVMAQLCRRRTHARPCPHTATATPAKEKVINEPKL